MADIITLSSDEEECSPPKKRIKPIPVPNLPNVTIIQIFKEKGKRTEVVSLCSDDEGNDAEGDTRVHPSDKKITSGNRFGLNENVDDDVICEDSGINIHNESIEINDVDEAESISPNTSTHNANVNVNDTGEVDPILKKLNGESTRNNSTSEPQENKLEGTNIADKDTEVTNSGLPAKNVNSKSIEIIDFDEAGPNKDDGKDVEDSCEVINGASSSKNTEENLSEDLTIVSDDVQPCSSSSSNKLPPPNTILLDTFLNIVGDNIQDSKYSTIKDKFPKLRSYYNKCVEEFGDSTNFKNMLTENSENAKKSATQSVICFNEIFQHLKDTVTASCIEVDKDQLVKLVKLEKTIKKLVMIIKKLEEKEIDFDLEEDSSYLQLDRYMARLDKVYKVYCEFLKKNPYCGRLTYSKLDFVDSEYNEINIAISKKYKNNKVFPGYYEIEKLIKTVSKDKKLGFSESKIKSESKYCFQQLGKLLQNRRRRELYESHSAYLKDSEDPAKDDDNLNTILKDSFVEGQTRIQKLVEEYVTKQDNKEDSEEEVQKASDKSSSHSGSSSSTNSEDDSDSEEDTNAKSSKKSEET